MCVVGAGNYCPVDNLYEINKWIKPKVRWDHESRQEPQNSPEGITFTKSSKSQIQKQKKYQGLSLKVAYFRHPSHCQVTFKLYTWLRLALNSWSCGYTSEILGLQECTTIPLSPIHLKVLTPEGQSHFCIWHCLPRAFSCSQGRFYVVPGIFHSHVKFLSMTQLASRPAIAKLSYSIGK